MKFRVRVGVAHRLDAKGDAMSTVGGAAAAAATAAAGAAVDAAAALHTVDIG